MNDGDLTLYMVLSVRVSVVSMKEHTVVHVLSF